MEKWNEKIDRAFHMIMFLICIILFITMLYAGFESLEKHLQEINYVEIMNGGF